MPTPHPARCAPTSPLRQRRRFPSSFTFAVALLVALLGGSRLAIAAPPFPAIEIDARAEALIDSRAVRRLVQLELADVEVRPAPGQRDTALFVRVLGADVGELRIELWERGIAYGSRTVAGPTGSSQLVARRVALAAAELARELRDEREDAAALAEQQRKRALEAARIARERTREGPRALRSGFVGYWANELALAGPELVGELHVYRALRLDLGAAWLGGGLEGGHSAQSAVLTLAASRRRALSRWLSLDSGVGITAGVFDFPDVQGVDGIVGQRQTWSAAAEGRLRLEPHLSRSVRLALGLGGGYFLREMPLEVDAGTTRRVGGPFLTGELALVITPF